MLNTNVWSQPNFAERESWGIWKVRWQKVSNLPDALNLIHSIFSLAKWPNLQDSSERICFLLELADGSYQVPRETHRSEANPEYVVRTKALAVLNAHFFTAKGLDNWRMAVTRCGPELFVKLLWFLRIEDPDKKLWRHLLVNRTESVENFAWEFCQFLWELTPHGNWDGANRETLQWMFERRAEALKIALALRRLHEMLPGHIDGGILQAVEQWERFDDDAVKVLRSLPSPYAGPDDAYLMDFAPEVAVRRILAGREAIKKVMKEDVILRALALDRHKKKEMALERLLAA